METTSTKRPYVFDEFFASGREEAVSPFFTPDSRRWAKNLSLKASLSAAFLLAVAFGLSFVPQLKPLSDLLLFLVYFLAGVPKLIDALENLLNLEVNIDLLMTLAAFCAIFIHSAMEGGLLLVLFAISAAIEKTVTAKARGALTQLNKLSPTRAAVVQADGAIAERAVKDIQVGMRLLVRAGEIVPLDGVVESGESSVNLVHLTGESLPVAKRPGDELAAGARNLEGSLVMRVVRAYDGSTLAKIIQLVTQAQQSRPKLQRWFDKFSRAYALSIILFSALLMATLPLFTQISYGGVEGSFYRALAFLIAASPCALIIAIPIAYLSAVGICARRGILLKGGVVLDALAHCRTVAFDKTGTITTGSLVCEGVEVVGVAQGEMPQALAIALALEQNVTHPIATAVQKLAVEKQVKPVSLEEFRSVAGQGVEGVVLGKEGERLAVRMGGAQYVSAQLSAAKQQELQQQIQRARQAGCLVAVLAIGEQAWLFRFRDAVRPRVRETIAALKQHLRLKLLMLTGDHPDIAQAIAKEVGIEQVYAELKPEDKLQQVSALAEKEPLAMVGDGLNDAPALARATVGISMGQVGSATAVDISDIVFLHDDIYLLDWLIHKSRQVQRIVKQNVILAGGFLLLASLLALLGIIPLWLAVFMHEGGTVIVGLNGLRLLRV